MPTTPLLFTLYQAAAILGCTPKWLADQLRARRFPARKVGRKWMLSEDDLDEIVRRCAVVAESASSADASVSGVQQAGSMTRTTLRRMRRGGVSR